MTMFAKIGDTVPSGAIVTDSNSHGVYYHMPEKKDPRDPGNWRDGDDAMGAFKEAVKPDEPINHEQEAKLHGFATKPDVGEEIGTLPPLRGESHPEVDAMCTESMKYAEPYEELWPNHGLRDMFAMHALQALVNNDRISDPKGMALRSYEYADAMMIAREMKR